MDGEQKLFGIFKCLFGEWIEAQGFDTEQMQKAHAGKFILWCREQWNADEDFEKKLAAAIPQLTADDYATARKLLFRDFEIWQVIFVWWPILSLAGRRPLQNKLAFAHVQFTFGFQDGTGVQLTVEAQNRGEEHFKSDGYMCSLLRSQVENVIESVMKTGLDEMHEKFGVPLVDRHGNPELPPDLTKPVNDAVTRIRRG